MFKFSSLLRRTAPRWALTLGVLALAGVGRADELDIRDLQHEVMACQALQDDAMLANLSLIVKVRKRVATLAGGVPSRELAQRAVECLKKLPDLIEVRDEMRVANEDFVFGPSPVFVKDRKFPPPTGTLTKLANEQRNKEPAPVPAVWQAVPSTTSIALMPAVSALGALPLPKDLSTARPADNAAIVSAVKNLMLSDERFRGLRFEVKENKVYLTGIVQRWADLHEVSRAINRIPGVEAVVFQSVASSQ
jgi:osmotically-inducible protein OsmY